MDKISSGGRTLRIPSRKSQRRLIWNSTSLSHLLLCCSLLIHVRRYKTDAAEITRSTGVGDINDLSQM